MLQCVPHHFQELILNSGTDLKFVVRELEGMPAEIGVSRRVWTLALPEGFTPQKHGFHHSKGQIEEC